MVRKIAGVIVGYLALVILVFAMLSIVYLAMGPDVAFRPSTYEASMTWIITSFILSFLAAGIAGYICAIIARDKRAWIALACLVVILGVLTAISVLISSNQVPETRTANVSNIEAMQKARQPAWVALMNPIVGAGGILLGARLNRRA